MRTQPNPPAPSPIVIFRLENNVVISETEPCARCGVPCMVNRLDYEEVVQYVPREEEGFRAFARSMDMRIVEPDEIDLNPTFDVKGRAICSDCSAPLPH